VNPYQKKLGKPGGIGGGGGETVWETYKPLLLAPNKRGRTRPSNHVKIVLLRD